MTRWLLVSLSSCSFIFAASIANAQSAAPPPPVYAPPPPTAVPMPSAPPTAPPSNVPPQPYAPPPSNYWASPPPYWSAPQRMDYEEGAPVPPGYHVASHVRRGLVIGGAVSFGVLYGLSVLIADSSSNSYSHDDYKPLYIPAIGPFIEMGKVSGGTGVLLLDGLGQTSGLIMFVCGLAFTKSELVRNDIASSVHVVPMAGAGRSGVALIGTF